MKKTSIAVLVASIFVSSGAYAGDAVTIVPGQTADSLNALQSTDTTVGNTSAASSTTVQSGTAVNITAPATNVSGTLGVAGVTSTNGLTNTGTLTQTGGVNINGATTINGVGSTANTTIGNPTGSATVKGSSVLIESQAGGLTIQSAGGNNFINAPGGTNTLSSTGNTISATGTNTIGGGTNNINGTTNITGATTINGATVINGATSINGALNMNGNVLNNLATGVATTDAVNVGQLNNAIAAVSGPANNPIITGASTVGSAQAVSGFRIANTGGTGTNVDANGKMTTGTVSQPTVSMTVTNGQGNTHGFVVNETQATMSGGINSTSLTLNDNGARFSNSASGAPVRVTGVANGVSTYDAVNYGQLQQIQSNTDQQFKQYAAGVAGVTAMTNIPQVDQNKTFSLGVGLGGYNSEGALAVGGSYRASQNAVIKASLATGLSETGSKTTSYGVGAGMSW